MGTRECDLDEPGDLLPGDNFDPGDLLIALEGEDIFLVPQSRSESRSVGKDDGLLVPQSRSESRSVGKDDSLLVPRAAMSLSRRRAAALVLASRGRSTSRPVYNDDTRTLSAKTKTRARRRRT
jgi:hypothetical protein